MNIQSSLSTSSDQPLPLSGYHVPHILKTFLRKVALASIQIQSFLMQNLEYHIQMSHMIKEINAIDYH